MCCPGSGTISGQEFTFAGLLAAFQISSSHNFIVVFTTDLALKAKIQNLKIQKKTEIFFIVVQFKGNKLHQGFGNQLPAMKKNFGGIGHVIDLEKYAVADVVDLMEASEICSGT